MRKERQRISREEKERRMTEAWFYERFGVDERTPETVRPTVLFDKSRPTDEMRK